MIDCIDRMNNHINYRQDSISPLVDIIEQNTAAIYFSFIFCISPYCYKIMRTAGIYFVQVEIGTVRNAIIPQGDISITLRIGRSSASTNFNNLLALNEIHFGSIIHLNVDNTALQTQRCSITFNGSDKRIVGIALISLPKDKSLLQNTYRLTQNQDKRAEVELKIKILPLDSISNQMSKNMSLQVKSEVSLSLQSIRPNETIKSSDNILPMIYTNVVKKVENNSNNPQVKVKSKISEEFSMQSDDRKTTKTFKLRQDDKMIQTTSSQIKRYKDQKQAYYQLYQIQKSKNQIASKFISNVIKKIGEKYPSLISSISDTEVKKSQTTDKRTYKSQQNSQAVDPVRIDQLQQANRSLHRQVQQYKKIVEQLKFELGRGSPKVQISKPIKPSNNFLFPGIFDFEGNKSSLRQKSTLKQKSNIKAPFSPSTIIQQQQPIKEQQKKPAINLQKIDFKKWIDMSIGQRESMQSMLGNLIQTPSQNLQKNQRLIKKLKTSLDKSFAALISKKQVTKDALINHRKEINRLFEEVVSY